MDLLQIVALVVIQGVTQFLPVGADTHQALAAAALPIDRSGAALALQLGAVLAVAAYFHGEIGSAVLGLFQATQGRRTPHTKLAGKIFAGSLPCLIAAAALLLTGAMPAAVSRAWLGWTMLGAGVVMLLADRMGMTVRRVEHIGAPAALILWVAQALALVPGIGRLAATLTIARFMGFERRDAARYAYLIGILALLEITLWHTCAEISVGGWRPGAPEAIGGLVSFFAAYATISFFMNWLRRSTLAPFALYRIVFGGALLYTFYT